MACSTLTAREKTILKQQTQLFKQAADKKTAIPTPKTPSQFSVMSETIPDQGKAKSSVGEIRWRRESSRPWLRHSYEARRDGCGGRSEAPGKAAQ
jgi:hypothetical protein